MKHTRGPWTFKDGAHKPRDQHERFTIECQSDLPGVPGIAGRCGYKPNARLIATAPELLQVAVDCYESLKYSNESGCFENGSNRAPVAIIRELGRLIQKAEGGE